MDYGIIFISQPFAAMIYCTAYLYMNRIKISAGKVKKYKGGHERVNSAQPLRDHHGNSMIKLVPFPLSMVTEPFNCFVSIKTS